MAVTDPTVELPEWLRPGAGIMVVQLKHFISSSLESRRARAFTTIELLGAVSISVILSIVALSGYRVFHRTMPLDQTASRLSHACSTARAYAINKNSTYSVKIDLTYLNFWIDETDENGNPIVSKVIRPEPIHDHVEVIEIRYGNVPVGPNATALPIRFFSDGSSDDVRIFLKLKSTDINRNENFHTLRIYGPTGHSKIFKRQRRQS
jgi:Tfp pilus assembly protein FimT